MIEVYFDGLCEPNPDGVATYGYAISKDGKEIKQGHGVIGKGRGMTNNVAEYSALQKALEYLTANKIRDEEIEVKGDSNLAVQQVKGNWKIKSGTSKKFVPLILELRKKLEAMNNKISFSQIPREKNQKADELSRIAYNEYVKSKR